MTHPVPFQAKFPGFVAGFDLVGQEDVGRRLLEYAEAIMTLPKEMKLFFHAGETNWNGMTDDNLVSTHSDSAPLFQCHQPLSTPCSSGGRHSPGN